MNWLRVSLSAALGMAAVAAFSPVEAATPANAFVMAKNIDDIISLDPGEAFELSGLEITTNVYDRVMRYDAEDVTKLVGGAVESWNVSEDGKTFTFKVRPGIKFSSGAGLTADRRGHRLLAAALGYPQQAARLHPPAARSRRQERQGPRQGSGSDDRPVHHQGGVRHHIRAQLPVRQPRLGGRQESRPRAREQRRSRQ